MTDGGADITATYGYDVFGATRSVTGSGSTAFLFTGEQGDDATSLYYLRARYYDPNTGRFLGRDPFSGLAGAPQSQNPYAYAENNPINLIDPEGLSAKEYFGSERIYSTQMAGPAAGSAVTLCLVTSPAGCAITIVVLGGGTIIYIYQDEIGNGLSGALDWVQESASDLRSFFSKGKSDKRRIDSAESHSKNIDEAIDKANIDPENDRLRGTQVRDANKALGNMRKEAEKAGPKASREIQELVKQAERRMTEAGFPILK